MARVFYMGAPSDVELPMDSSVQDRLSATGNNTGNLLIGHAIKRHLKIDILGKGMSTDATYIDQNFDYIVIGASNFLFPRFDFSAYADFVDKTHLPCIIIGLGAQAPNYDSKLHIPEGTKRLMKIISERSATLGVRGRFTASVLEAIGIKNIRIIGCPSMYWTCDPHFEISQKAPVECQKIALNGSANVVEHASDEGAARKVESLLANLSFKNKYPYILQNETALMDIAFDKTASPASSLLPFLYEKGLIYSLKKKYGLSEINDDDFISFVKSNMITFFDIDEWMDFIRSFDFVVGSRFHGCLIALLNGVPANVFVHDTRTKEMCELLSIPHVGITEVEDIDLKSLYESVNLNAMQKAYPFAFKNYIDFLEENKIEHNLKQFAVQGSGDQASGEGGRFEG